jgi:hypothetical protein
MVTRDGKQLVRQTSVAGQSAKPQVRHKVSPLRQRVIGDMELGMQKDPPRHHGHIAGQDVAHLDGSVRLRGALFQYSGQVLSGVPVPHEEWPRRCGRTAACERRRCQ